jgi:RNA polymerase sigma-70 factor (ECF subfamily)
MLKARLANVHGLLARSRSSPYTFAEFYEEMAPGVLRFFVGETRDGHRAHDLTAETFAKAFEKRNDFRGASDQQAAAWLWRIARNELAMFHRSRAVEMAAMQRLGIERQTLTDDELLEIESLALEPYVRDRLSEALGRLPSDQREVIRLRFLNELSYQEIAKTLGVSNEVVRTRTSRGLRALRSNEHLRDVRHLRKA